jgi:hypothetical protein
MMDMKKEEIKNVLEQMMVMKIEDKIDQEEIMEMKIDKEEMLNRE